MKQLRIDVWSDIACPWCYVGKRRLEAALARFESEAEVVWRAFELDPSAPPVHAPEPTYLERLADKYRIDTARAQGMIDRMTETAADEGLTFRFDLVQAGNTFDAHRLLHLARERRCQDAMKERLLSAYFCEGRALGETEVLIEQAAKVGIDEAAAREVLEGDGFSREVRRDEEEARTIGATGVPFFVVGGRFAFSGAQLPDTIVHVIEQAQNELAAPAEAEGIACGPAGCD